MREFQVRWRAENRAGNVLGSNVEAVVAENARLAESAIRNKVSVRYPPSYYVTAMVVDHTGKAIPAPVPADMELVDIRIDMTSGSSSPYTYSAPKGHLGIGDRVVVQFNHTTRLGRVAAKRDAMPAGVTYEQIKVVIGRVVMFTADADGDKFSPFVWRKGRLTFGGLDLSDTDISPAGS
jgi:hypothetical protein